MCFFDQEMSEIKQARQLVLTVYLKLPFLWKSWIHKLHSPTFVIWPKTKKNRYDRFQSGWFIIGTALHYSETTGQKNGKSHHCTWIEKKDYKLFFLFLKFRNKTFDREPKPWSILTHWACPDFERTWVYWQMN